jgi:AraC-like DNA-binding protein
MSWDGGCALLGRAHGITPMHAHYAIQIAFGSAPGIRFRPSDDDAWSEYGAAIIPSRQPHTMDATVVPSNVVIFVEPETRDGRALVERYLQQGIAELPAAVLGDAPAALFRAWHEHRSRDAITEAARHVVRVLTGGAAPVAVADERVLRAIAYIKAHLSQPITLERVAEEACLSPSRFRHLFVEETGMAFRPYVLWRRFVRVWELTMANASLSTAAHEAGFADAAHLSRTSRQMFGFPPSALQFVAPTANPDAPER